MTLTKLLLLLLVALVFEAIGVVFLSQGLRQIGEFQQLNVPELLRVIGRGVTNGRILLGVFMETIFFALLLIMLRSWDVSLVWPLTALGFVLTTLAARVLAREEVHAVRWIGVILIVAGAVLVGYSEMLKKPRVQSGSIGAGDQPEQNLRESPGG